MLSSSILDVAIGMAFIYLLLSLIASTIQEAIASLLQFRSANLERGIRSLFSDGALADGTRFVDRVYRHGLVMGLYREQEDGGMRVAPGTDAATPEEDWRMWLRRKLRILPGKGISGIVDPFLLPSYIPARTFAMTLLDILKTESAKQDPPQTIQEYLKDLCDPEQVKIRAARELAATVENASATSSAVAGIEAPAPADTVKTATAPHPAAEAMLALLNDAYSIDGKMPPEEKFRCHLENWYNDSMDRASGWYKKYTQNFLLAIGLILAILFNVDSITVGKKLWFDKDARSGLISAAGSYVDKHTEAPKVPSQPGQSTLTRQELADQMKTTVQAFNDVSETYLLPVGWHYSLAEYRYHVTHPDEWQLIHILQQIAGWIITALALSLGAPFWFDLLNKFMVVRSTVKPQEKSRTEASKDAA